MKSIELLEVDVFINYFKRRFTRHRVPPNIATKSVYLSQFFKY